MNFKTPTEVPEELLGRAGCPEGLTKYDIVVIGTQESGPIQVLARPADGGSGLKASEQLHACRAV